jgi:hypothetical protein
LRKYQTNFFHQKKNLGKKKAKKKNSFFTKKNKMCIIKQCCAPIGDKRCSNPTLNANCDHCEIHQEEHLRLYLKYKEICAVANSKKIYVKIKDRHQHIKHLMHCLRWLENAYDAREEHQLRAYVAETVDYGHKEQFNIIQDKIDFCREKVAQLYKELEEIETYKEEEEEIEESESELPLEEISEITIVEKSEDTKSSILDKIEIFKNKQTKDKLEFDKILKKNTKENEKIKREKTKAATLCKNLINELLDSHRLWTEYSNKSEHQMFLELAVFTTLIELHNLRYYSDDYEPEECPNCDCGNFKESEYKLGCPCFLKKGNDTISVLAYNDLEHIKVISQEIIYYSELIDPIVEDLIGCYKKHGTRLIKKMMMFLWDPDQERLVLSYDGVTWKSKPSEQFKLMRKKKTLRSHDVISDRDDDEMTFKDFLRDLCNFIDRNDKLPSSNSKQIHTRMLYDWLREQQQNYRNEYGTMLIPENRACFEKFLTRYDYYL